MYERQSEAPDRNRPPLPLTVPAAPVAAGERRWLQRRNPRAGRAMLGT